MCTSAAASWLTATLMRNTKNWWPRPAACLRPSERSLTSLAGPRWIDINARLIESDQAAVPAADLGVLYGIGLFTTILVRHGQPFRLPAHLQRLLDSAERLSLPIGLDQLPGATRVARLLAANELRDARLRLTVTGGTRDGQQVHHTVLLSAAPYEAYPQGYYADGVTAWVCPQAQDAS